MTVSIVVLNLIVSVNRYSLRFLSIIAEVRKSVLKGEKEQNLVSVVNSYKKKQFIELLGK